jgi:hypothetical protein
MLAPYNGRIIRTRPAPSIRARERAIPITHRLRLPFTQRPRRLRMDLAHTSPRKSVIHGQHPPVPTSRRTDTIWTTAAWRPDGFRGYASQS